MNRTEIVNALCIVYKAQIINTLKDLGLEYSEGIKVKNLKDINLKYFISWAKKIDSSTDYQNLEIHKVLYSLTEYIEYLKSDGYKRIKFNLRDVEPLNNRDSFATLFRTCVVFEGLK